MREQIEDVGVRRESEPLLAFHVPAMASSEIVSGWVGFAMFVGLAVACCVVGIAWMAVLILPIIVAMAGSVQKGRRLKGRGTLFDEEGLGPAEEGERLWTLRWRDYGGFRRSVPTGWDWFRHPERSGYEILDTKGQRSFYLTMPQGGVSTAHLRQAASEELRRRLPLGTEDPCAVLPPVQRKPSPRTAVIQLTVVVVCGLVATWGLADPLSPSSIVGAFSAIIGLGVAIAAAFEIFYLLRWHKGWRPKPIPNALPDLPEEGPSAARHRARHERQPITLEEGVRYRTVDLEQRRKELRTSVKAGWGLLPMGAGITLFYIVGVVNDPRMLPISLVGVMMFGAMTSIIVGQLAGAKQLLKNVDDTLWVHDGTLVAVRAGREPLTLPLPTATDRQALRRRSFTGVTDLLVAKDGTRYALDRTRLYVAPQIAID